MNIVNIIYYQHKQNVMPKHSLLALLLGLLFLQRLPAQPPAANLPRKPAEPFPTFFSSILDNYLRIGLDSNLALHQRNFDLQRSLLDLKRARAQFYPQAGFSSQYTLADGGRTQSIPVGDLLNGVYSTLNQLTGTNKFPTGSQPVGPVSTQ
jgi:outer membrane protein TolC